MGGELVEVEDGALDGTVGDEEKKKLLKKTEASVAAAEERKPLFSAVSPRDSIFGN